MGILLFVYSTNIYWALCEPGSSQGLGDSSQEHDMVLALKSLQSGGKTDRETSKLIIMINDRLSQGGRAEHDWEMQPGLIREVFLEEGIS